MGELQTKRDWYPQCFVELRDKIQACGDPVAQGAAKGLSVSLGDKNETRIAGLSQAASKFRLAREFQSAQFSSYQDRTAIGYSSVFRMTFAVIAFESYGRMFGKTKWHQFDQELCGYISKPCIAAARQNFQKQQPSIVSALTDAMLQKRINSFFGTEDNEVIALAVAMRHAFAHGKLGATVQYSLSRDALACEIIGAIEKHCASVSASLN
jgi:hypothetical protein